MHPAVPIRFVFTLSLIGWLNLGLAKLTAQPAAHSTARPKLVVGIVIDQMRYDLLYRYYNQYAEKGGFKRLMHSGFSYASAHYNYTPTYTGPGHASVYTGTTPSVHGIVANDWYDRSRRKNTYCSEDSTEKNIGSFREDRGMSPRTLFTSTLGDQIRMATNFRGKSIGIALKDRGGILPSGHSANAAYWFDAYNGNWISSTYYMQALPEWVNKFNARKLPDSLSKAGWQPSLPLSQYTNSTADDMPYEAVATPPGSPKPVLPYTLYVRDKTDRAGMYADLMPSPAGNDLTVQFAMAVVAAEQLGKDEDTDMLAVSFSSPDYCGHAFGPNSVEMEDMYIKLDKQLAALFDHLERVVGKGQVLYFLTADHGGANVPQYLNMNKIPAGRFDHRKFEKDLDVYLDGRYGAADWVMRYTNQEVYLNRNTIDNMKADYNTVCDAVVQFALQHDAVSQCITPRQMEAGAPSTLQRQAGYHPKRSGDVYISYKPAWFDDYLAFQKGTTHGSQYSYDTHVPMLFYGWRVQPGVAYRNVRIIDIAPTISSLLHIENPNGCTGEPLTEVLERALGK